VPYPLITFTLCYRKNVLCTLHYVVEIECSAKGRGSRVQFLAGAENFSLHHRAHNGSGSYPPPIQWIPGAPSLGVKWPKREADYSPSSSAEVKNAWSYTSIPYTSSCRGYYLGTGTTIHLPLQKSLYIQMRLLMSR